MGAVIVGAERVVLETWTDDDVHDLASIGTTNVVRFLGGVQWTDDDARDSIAVWRSIDDRLGVTTWAVRLRDTGELIGSCGFAGTNMPWLRFDYVIEIGWTLAERWWGRGLATEAALAALSVGLERYSRDRFLSKCHVENSASERVMRRVGMTRAGVVQGNFAAPTAVYRFP